MFRYVFAMQQQNIFLDNLPKQYIEIGSFGGIVGLSKTYYLLPNGQRFMKQSTMGASSQKYQ